MDDTPNLKLPYILAAQAQKHVTHNEAIRALDALVQLSVADKDNATPPASPVEGVRYIVGASATGAWTGKSTQIAAFQDGAWAFYVPRTGFRAWVADENLLYAWNGTTWTIAGQAINPTLLVGVNTTADATNKLSVKSDAILMSHDDVTPGTGDVQAKINKSAAGKTAALLFQTAFSGRAEMGTTGDDDFHFKVSPNGSSWNEALIIDRATGAISFPLTEVGGRVRAPQVFKVSGTWTKPARCKRIRVTVIGAGGGGGGAEGAAASASAGAGGSAGGMTIKDMDAAALTTVTVTVGAGGAGGAAGNNAGSTGGTSSFGAHCSATGGGGGLSMAAGTTDALSSQGSAGAATGGDLNIPGNVGTSGMRFSATISQGGQGAAAAAFSSGTFGRSSSNAGQSNPTYGGGGGGARTSTATGYAGGSGGDGLVIVEEFL